MNPYEEEMQEKLERGQKPAGDGLDVKAYQAVFQALKKDPRYDLRPDFAERVAGRVMRRGKSGFSKDYMWFGAGIFFLIIALIGTILYTGFRFDLGFLKVMSDYKGLAVFGIAFVVFLNWLDKKLVKEKQFQHRI
ncbi:MAG: hypothetical protein WEB30_08775 [Cyclobacteriaceae bacterium]